MAKSTVELRRTRRVQNPFDARLELRLYSTEKAKLLHEAEKRGMSGSDLVRSQLGDLINAPPPDPQEKAKAKEAEVPVDLIDVIADRMGESWGKALLMLRTGKVTVKGEVYAFEQIPKNQLKHVQVDGLPLPSE